MSNTRKLPPAPVQKPPEEQEPELPELPVDVEIDTQALWRVVLNAATLDGSPEADRMARHATKLLAAAGKRPPMKQEVTEETTVDDLLKRINRLSNDRRLAALLHPKMRDPADIPFRM